MRRIHSFSEFNFLYEADETNPASAKKKKLYDQTLGMILTTILNSYSSLVSFPESPYDSKIEPELITVKGSPVKDKVSAFLKIMEKVKQASASNKIPGAQEAVDAWIAVGTKAGEALTAMLNQYKDKEEEQKYINDFINTSIDNYIKELKGASQENPLKKDIAQKVNDSYTYSGDPIFEGLLSGKKGKIEDVSKQITLVLAKLAALESTPGMADDVAKLKSEVNQIAVQMGDLLNKKNKDINKEDIKKAAARLAEIPTLLDKTAQDMLKQDTTNKEAASILIQALALVKAAKEKETEYLNKKAESEEKEKVSYSKDNIGKVNPTVQKFQNLVVDKFKNSKQISSLSFYKKMGTDGKYGPATKAMVEIMKSGFGLKDTSGDTITVELLKELEKQQPLKESRIYSFGRFSFGDINEEFDVEKAIKVSKEIKSASASSKSADSSGPSILFKEGDTGDVVIAINRIVGQTKDEKNYTSETGARVKAFQKINGLKDDGKVGRKTLEALFGTRDSAKTHKLTDPNVPRGPWAYKTIGNVLKEEYKAPQKSESPKVTGDIGKVVYGLLSGSLLAAGTDEEKILNSIMRIKSPSDFKAANEVIKSAYGKNLGQSKSEKDTSELKTSLSKILPQNLVDEILSKYSFFNKEYKSIAGIINGELGSSDTETVEDIAKHLNSIGVKCSYEKDSDGDFAEDSFKIPGY